MSSRHRPDLGEYGDCLRTVIASLLEMEPPTVPHFAYDNADGETTWKRCNDFLAMHGMTTLRVLFPGEEPVERVLEHMSFINPGIYYILAHFNGHENHVVVGLNDRIVYDPGWGGIHLDQMKPPKGAPFWELYFLISNRMRAE